MIAMQCWPYNDEAAEDKNLLQMPKGANYRSKSLAEHYTLKDRILRCLSLVVIAASCISEFYLVSWAPRIAHYDGISGLDTVLCFNTLVCSMLPRALKSLETWFALYEEVKAEMHLVRKDKHWLMWVRNPVNTRYWWNLNGQITFHQ